MYVLGSIGSEPLGIIMSPLTALMDQQVWMSLNHANASEVVSALLVKSLTCVGVSAVHIESSGIVCEDDVAARKFHFGM